ncbi:MAG TPA: polysaccharide deacetylase family protein [Candidatus Acidoferrum sp.]|nr:polysaccharide deacetylase family protein [Candidatus Acidoferrum sp.]
MPATPKGARRILALLALGFVIVTVASAVLIHSRTPRATALMYHAVVDDREGSAGVPSLGRAPFERQMDFVATHGYQTVFVKDVVARYEAKTRMPSRWLALTFDGGFPDFYTNVYPVLRRHGLRATLFVIVADVGVDGGLSWDQLREVSASGLVEIGSHSYDHAADECLSLAEAREEKARSRAELERNLGIEVLSYAYPYGAFSERARRLLRETGYRGAVGTVYRWGEFEDDDAFNVRRVYVSDYSRLPLMFRFMLSGYYVPTRSLILRVLNIKTPRDIGCTPPPAH